MHLMGKGPGAILNFKTFLYFINRLLAGSRTQPSDFTFTFPFHALEKEMATHSSVLAWRIPGTAEGSAIYGVAQIQTRLK